MKYTKYTKGTHAQAGSLWFASNRASIIYLVKKILRRKGGTWLIKIVQNGKERIVTAITVFC